MSDRVDVGVRTNKGAGRRRALTGLILAGLVLFVAACGGSPFEPTPTAISLPATATPRPRLTQPPTVAAAPAATERPPSATPAAGIGAASVTATEPAVLAELDDLLARRAAELFLDRLVAGEDAGLLRLLLTDGAQQGRAGLALADLVAAQSRPAEAALLEFKRVTPASYEARALLRWTGSGEQGPVTRPATLTLAYQRGLWLVADITISDAQTASPTAAPGATTARRQPSPPGLAGRIVFQVSSGGDIYLVNADGGEKNPLGLQRLTDGLDPAWSPDGSQIAFARWRNPWGVYLIRPDGSGERRVLDGNRLKEVAWSPDGSALAVSINYSSSEPMEICFFGFCFTIPPFSVGQIWTADLDSGALLSLPLDDAAVHAPAWSPTENRLVYAGDHGLAWIDLDTMDKGRFAGGSAWDTSPSFSPDGRLVAFMGRVHDHWEIFVMNADGSGRRQLTQSEARQGQPPSNVAPAWSPDGEQIAFLSNRDGPWRIYVMNADGSEQRAMFGARLDHLGIRYEWATERVLSWHR